jgi:hypothetical protein
LLQKTAAAAVTVGGQLQQQCRAGSGAYCMQLQQVISIAFIRWRKPLQSQIQFAASDRCKELAVGHFVKKMMIHLNYQWQNLLKALLLALQRATALCHAVALAVLSPGELGEQGQDRPCNQIDVIYALTL